MGASPLPAASLGVLLPAVLVFALAYDGGGYSVESRGSWAIGTWWLLALGVVLGWWPTRALSRTGIAVVAVLAGFALLTLASASWSSNDAVAFSEFNRVTFYLGAFLLVLFVAPRLPLHRIGDGLALGLVGVVVVALVSRLAPGLISDRGLAEAFPGAADRLSHPVGYWNGLAILVALAVPLLLRAAASPGHSIPQALAAAPLPAVAATIYLTSSRGGVATGVIGAFAYLVLGRYRWRTVSALGAAAAGTAIVLGGFDFHSDFVNEPETASTSARVSVALVLLLGCAIAFAIQAGLTSVFAGRTAPRGAGVTAAIAGVVVGLVGLAATNPVERFRTFKQPPPEGVATDDFVQSHLVSVGGSGRWQFWEAAVDAWHDAPLLGHGAGSFEVWWAQHGTLPRFIRDAHSLYLGTLAELGVAGLALLVALAALTLFAGWRRIRVLSAPRADAIAAATAVVVAYGVAAGIEWVSELPVVTLVALACLAVVLAPAGSPAARTAMPARVTFAILAVAVVVAQGIPYLSQVRIRESQSASARSDLAGALASAQDARAVQPWAPDPWLQLALVHEQRGELEDARTAIERATREGRDDWRLWLVAARLQTKVGDVEDARKSLKRAVELNPRSPLFASLP